LDGVRVLALGEATHGSRELFQLKDRLLEFLVQDRGFRLFALEASAPAAEVANDYALHGHGSLRDAVGRLGFWTWDTEEMAYMLDWMRRYNAGQPPAARIRFMGIDMQVLGRAYDSLTSFVRLAAPRLAAAFDSVIVAQRAAMQGQQPVTQRIDAAARRLPRTQSLVARFVADSARLGTRLDSLRLARALWYARLLLQCDRVIAHQQERDSLMAANVLGILRRDSTARMIVWAHNQHISRTGQLSRTSQVMGAYLAGALARRYYAMALTFDDGSFRARDMEQGNRLTTFRVGRARQESVESVLARIPLDQYAVDLRSAPDTGQVASWLSTPRSLRSIGAGFGWALERRGGFEETTSLATDYDGVIFVRHSTASRPLRSRPSLRAPEP
jgi:erythromycin esterase